MIFNVWFFVLTANSFPMLSVKNMMLQLCLSYTDLLRIEHPLIWYDLFLHKIGIGRDNAD